MPYLDTCDRCLTEDSQPITPAKIAPNGPGSVLATYRCPDCGSIWTCGWAAENDDAA
ncbi:hypothetical protein ACF061_01015 [Streptomyces sp. NPDC015220]|uniref:hypothetical protein n=1 Tax=Streptomyces sp. NPDC015220 TaxID=3364947 RepID=UPI003700F103